MFKLLYTSVILFSLTGCFSSKKTSPNCPIKKEVDGKIFILFENHNDNYYSLKKTLFLNNDAQKLEDAKEINPFRNANYELISKDAKCIISDSILVTELFLDSTSSLLNNHLITYIYTGGMGIKNISSRQFYKDENNQIILAFNFKGYFLYHKTNKYEIVYYSTLKVSELAKSSIKKFKLDKLNLNVVETIQFDEVIENIDIGVKEKIKDTKD